MLTLRRVLTEHHSETHDDDDDDDSGGYDDGDSKGRFLCFWRQQIDREKLLS